jgi:serine protease Do
MGVRSLAGSTRPGGRETAWRWPLWLALIGLPLLATTEGSAEDPFLRRTATVRVVEKVGPAVVSITTERVVAVQSPFRGFAPFDPRTNPFFRDFFDPRQRRAHETVTNLGSGVIIDRDRHILTNEHVVRSASRIRINLADGREFEATLVGADPNNDLAVLQVEAEEELPWIAPGSSGDLLVGEPVIAIGNPFGLSNTVTTGVVSALDRSIAAGDQTYHGFLQTDASINPGNSGGPLLNAEGTLIGINSAIYNGAEGIGFAIPIDAAKRVISELIEHGEITPVWLGLEFQNLDHTLHEVMGLPRNVNGALVNAVRKDSPAGRAGVRRGDIVTRFNGHSVQSARDFFESLETVTVDQKLRLELWRESAATEIVVVAQKIPESLVRELAEQYLGMQLDSRDQGGFLISRVLPGSNAARIGFRSGDLLLAINGQPLGDRDDLRSAILKLRGRGRALVVVQRGGGRYHVAIPLV